MTSLMLYLLCWRCHRHLCVTTIWHCYNISTWYMSD